MEYVDIVGSLPSNAVLPDGASSYVERLPDTYLFLIQRIHHQDKDLRVCNMIDVHKLGALEYKPMEINESFVRRLTTQLTVNRT